MNDETTDPGKLASGELAAWYDAVYHGGRVEGGKPRGKPATQLLQERRNRRCLAAMDIHEGHKVLEAGCSNGETIYALDREWGATRITAVDFSAVAVAYCQRIYPRTVCLRADVSELPFADNCFERVVCFDVTEHLHPDVYAKALAELLRVTRPGCVAGVIPGLSRRPEHINVRTVEQVAQDMTAAGWHVKAAKEWIIGVKPRTVAE